MRKPKPSTHPIPTTYIRFLIGTPIDTHLSIYFDDYCITKTITHGLFSQYIEVPAHMHQLKFTKKKTKEILLEKQINLRPYSVFTYILHTLPNTSEPCFQLYAIEETFRPCHFEKCFVRLHHTTPQCEPIYLSCPSTEFISTHLSYGQFSRYASFTPGTYDFIISTTSDPKPLYTLHSHLLKPQRFYTFYWLDSDCSHTPYEILPSIDGNSFLENKSPTTSNL